MRGEDIRFLEKSEVKLNFTNKRITAYGGFALLGKLFEKIELKKNVERIFPVVERSPNGKGIYGKILRFGLAVIAGGERFSHCGFLGDCDEIYKKIFGVEKMATSVSSLTRMFGKVKSWQKETVLAEGLWEYVVRGVIGRDKVEEDSLTTDSSVMVRYGKQEGAKKGYNPKKRGRPSHHPLLAFLNGAGYVVNLWNRRGDTASGNGIVEFVKETFARLEGHIKVVRYLGDSGFYRIDLISYLEEICVEYVIAAVMSKSIQSAILSVEKWKMVHPGIEVGEFEFKHEDNKWVRPRRYVVVRQWVKDINNPPQGKQLSLFPDEGASKKYRYSVYVTSSLRPADEIWRTYRLRAKDENVIKELKEAFGLEGFCLQGFYGTESAMLIRALFYNILTLFRRRVLTGSESNQTLKTIRPKYFIIPGLLGRNGRDPVLRLAVSDRSKKSKIRWIISRLDDLFPNGFAFEPCSDLAST